MEQAQPQIGWQDAAHPTRPLAVVPEPLDDHVLSAEELVSQFPPAPTIGQEVGMFEVAQVTDA